MAVSILYKFKSLTSHSLIHDSAQREHFHLGKPLRATLHQGRLQILKSSGLSRLSQKCQNLNTFAIRYCGGSHAVTFPTRVLQRKLLMTRTLKIPLPHSTRTCGFCRSCTAPMGGHCFKPSKILLFTFMVTFSFLLSVVIEFSRNKVPQISCNFPKISPGELSPL